jgi:hypothetical protein
VITGGDRGGGRGPPPPKCLLTMKSEHHIPYFKTINTLFDGAVFKLTNKSFIAEHMMVNKDIIELFGNFSFRAHFH